MRSTGSTKAEEKEGPVGGADREDAAKGRPDCGPETRRYIICMVNESMPGDAPAMCVRHGLLKGFVTAFGGTYVRGSAMTLAGIECPEGDVGTARQEVVGRVPMFTATSMGLAEKAAEELASLAEEKRLAGMGILPLRWALDRTGARYDVFDADALDGTMEGRR